MKKVLIVALMLLGIGARAQNAFYYYQGAQIGLSYNNAILSVWTKDMTQDQFQALISNSDYDLQAYETQDLMNSVDPTADGPSSMILNQATLKLRDGIPVQNEQPFIEQLRADASVVAVTSALTYGSRNDIILSNCVLVKLKSPKDYSQLQQEASRARATILGSSSFQPLWYVVLCNKNSAGDAISVANTFFETGWFEAAEPDMLSNMQLFCTNDSYFSSQWGLSNTGATGGVSGVDLKACNAWATTIGDPGIVTAIVDEGFEMNHPDLSANVYGTGWDANSGTAPSVVHGDHGTACAGIVAAVQNNNLGVSGIAPGSKIMSISVDFFSITNSGLGNAITYAKNHGAAIISCSWGGGSPTSYIDNAITDALANGRGGLGCVVAFSNGNNNINGGEYPANSNADIIAVGAIDKCGYRSGRIDVIPSSCDPWCAACYPASSYGNDLDVVAPGSGVYTTDRQGSNGYDPSDYYSDFGGTSSACPYVAGVAALILSVNPCLTQGQVSDIINRTAQKVNTAAYSYTPSGSHPQGLWNSQLGYGLVDADAAVQLATTTYLQNTTETATKNYMNFRIRAGYNVTPYTAAGNYLVSSGANVTARASQDVILENGFEAANGSFFEARIETGSVPCNQWSAPILHRQANPAAAPVAMASMPDEVKVYPNPAADHLYVEYDLPTDAPVSIVLTNIYGQVVYRSSAQQQQGHHKEEIAALGNLASGVYVLNLCRQNECVARRVIRSAQ